MARSSVVALDSALRDKMVLDIASKIDTAFLTGAGGTEPLGLINYTGVQSVAAVGTLTLDKLLDAVALAYSANVDTARLRWMMPSRTFIALRKIKDCPTATRRVKPRPDMRNLRTSESDPGGSVGGETDLSRRTHLYRQE